MGIIKRCEECGKPETDQCLVPSHGGINELWCLDCMRSAGRCISCATDIRLIVENYSEYDHDECPICLNKNNSMTPHILNGFSVLIPDIPEGATDVKLDLSPEDDWYAFSYTTQIDDEESGFYGESGETDIEIPPGDWRLLKLSEVPEELAGEMVDSYEDSNDSSYDPMYNVTTYFTVYEDYLNGDDFDTAHASLTSWVRSKGVSGDPYLLIKKNN